MSYQFGHVDPDERADFSAPEAPERGRRSLWVSFAAVLVMALFAGGLWFAYKEGLRHGAGSGAVPLIRADRSPEKVRPASPGGMKIPDQNLLIYNETEPRIEHLLPAPEKPMARPAPPRPSERHFVPAPSTAAVQPAVVPSRAVPETAGPTSQPRPMPRPELRPIAPERPLPRRQPAAGTAGPRIQLGALRSADLAQRQWKMLRRANASLLGKLSAETVRVDLGAKGVFYRIEAGPFASPEAAAHLCEELRQRKVGCLLVP